MTTTVLVYNQKRYAPLGSPLPKECNGFYKKGPIGSGKIHLYTTDGEVGALLIDNQRQGTFVVTATKVQNGIRYMYSTCSHTEKWLGIDTLGYMESHDAIKGIQFVVEGQESAELELT